MSKIHSDSLVTRLAATLPLLVVTACASLNYPTDDVANAPESSESSGAAGTAEVPAIAEASTPAPPPEAPVLISMAPDATGDGVETADLAEAGESAAVAFAAEESEEARSWYALTRLAREKRQLGKFDETAEYLEQAALQLAGRPPSNAQRRTVLGMRARLALDLFALQRDADAEALSDLLFEEVEAEPEVGGPAIIDLASYVVQLRVARANEDGLEASPLPLMRLALQSAETGNPTRERIRLAYEVAREAEREGDLDFARAALDRAIADTRIVESANLEQLTTLELHRARMAIDAGAFEEAEEAAAAANRMLAEYDAPVTSLAIAESAMAHVVAERGDAERARAIARTAQSRLGGDPPMPDAAVRLVEGQLARMERALGDLDAARAHYTTALDLPGTENPADVDLTRRLAEELQALAPADDGPRVELDVE